MSVSGIYCIVNIVNGKRYVGQSVDIELRKRGHFSHLKCGIHDNSYLQASFNKHGIDSFEFRVLEEVPIDMLDIRERAWINYYQSNLRRFGYNIEDGGNPNKHLSIETRRKISLAHRGKVYSPERCLKMSIAQKGHHVMSDENRKKLLEVHKGFRYSVESRRKMSEAQKRRKPFSSETRRKMSESGRGKVLSEETRRKISDAQKGDKNWNHGKHLSEETKQKISKIKKGVRRSEETCRKISDGRTGKTFPRNKNKGGI